MRSLLRSDASAGMLNRWVRHLIAGGLGTLLYVTLVALLVERGSLDPVASVVFACLILVLYTYAVNRRWVYAATQGHLYSIPRFVAVTITAVALNVGIMQFTVGLMHWWYFWGLLLSAVVVPPTNFLLNYYWAFR